MRAAPPPIRAPPHPRPATGARDRQPARTSRSLAANASGSPVWRTRRRAIWLVLPVGFAALNGWALASASWDRVMRYFTTMGPIDVVAATDLVIALLIGIVLVARNARQRSIRSTPYVLLTLLTGSIGLLGYLARHGVADSGQASEVTT